MVSVLKMHIFLTCQYALKDFILKIWIVKKFFILDDLMT